MKKHVIIPIFVPHMGCGFECVFCNQRNITGKSSAFDISTIEATILEYKDFLKGNEYVEVAFFGGSFTGIKENLQKEMLSIAKKYKDEGFLKAIRLSTRPDYINAYILDYLKEYSVDIIELGVQSLDEEVLSISKRGHSREVVFESAKLIKEYGFELGLQMMVGLPCDTHEKDIMTAKAFLSMNPDCVRIYPALVIKDTEMCEMYREGTFHPYTLEQTVEICVELAMFFHYYDINLIRLGLQTTENINEGKDVVAGPFHPAIRQIVDSMIFREVVDDFFFENEIITENEEIVFYVHSSRVSESAGHKKMNVEYFATKYGFKNIRFNKIKTDDMFVEISGKKYRIDFDKHIEKILTTKGTIHEVRG